MITIIYWQKYFRDWILVTHWNVFEKKGDDDMLQKGEAVQSHKKELRACLGVFFFSVSGCVCIKRLFFSVSQNQADCNGVFCSSGRKVERECKLLFPLDKHWHRSWQLVPKIQERQKEVFFANVHHCTNMQQHGATSPFHSFLCIWSFDFFKTVHLVSKHWKVWLIAPESGFSPFGCFI